jgi:hypothetical protein
MTRPTLYIAITNHGFGHATRAAAVAETVSQLRPDIELILATTAPEWLLRAYLTRDFVYRPLRIDIGVLQSDSLTMDKPATLEKLQWIRANQMTLMNEEIAFIRQAGVGLLLADIPPLATALAKAAGIPCWMMSNFGWDFIYRPWGGEFVAIADWIGECFGQCDRMFRLPFHESMKAFPVIEDVGLTGGTPRYDPEQLRSQLQITTPPERTMLLTFGGLGLSSIPYSGLLALSDWQFLTFDQAAPDLANLTRISGHELRPVDVMVICDRILSKPGYSTFAEACRLNKGILTLPRDDFAEAALLLAGIQNHTHHQIILDADAFFQGDCSALIAPLQPPKLAEPLATNGNDTIAQAIANYFS